MSTKFYGPHAWMPVTHAIPDGFLFPNHTLIGGLAFSNTEQECACHRIYTDKPEDSVVDVYLWLQSDQLGGEAVFQVGGYGEQQVFTVTFPEPTHEYDFPLVKLKVAEAFSLVPNPVSPGSYAILMRLDRLVPEEQTLPGLVAVVRTEVVGVAS